VKPTLRMKIVSGFAIATVAMVLVGLFSGSLLTGVRDNDENSASTSATQLAEVGDATLELMSGLHSAINLFYNVGAEDQQQFIDLARKDMNLGTEKVLALGRQPLSPEARDLYLELRATTSWFNQLANDLFALDLPVPDLSVPHVDTQKGLVIDFDEHSIALRTQLSALREQITRDAEEERAAAAAEATSSLGQLLVVVLAAGVGMILFGMWLANRLARRIRGTVDVLQRVAEGDLTAQFDDQGRDEVGEMALALNASVTTIRDVIRQIETDADTLARLAQLGLAKDRALSSGSASTSMSSSFDTSAELATMAANLNTMISVFVVGSATADEAAAGTRHA
jgi:HAMP domain-containing protein